jgi:hypothetical protein
MGSSEYTTAGLSYPYNLMEFATPIKGPTLSSCALVRVNVCARIYFESMHVHMALKIGTPLSLAICLFTYKNIN